MKKEMTRSHYWGTVSIAEEQNALPEGFEFLTNHAADSRPSKLPTTKSVAELATQYANNGRNAQLIVVRHPTESGVVTVGVKRKI